LVRYSVLKVPCRLPTTCIVYYIARMLSTVFSTFCTFLHSRRASEKYPDVAAIFRRLDYNSTSFYSCQQFFVKNFTFFWSN
jgi:hypothetical protein